MATLRMSLIAAILFGALIFLQYRLWFEPGGIAEMAQLKKKIASQMKDNDKFKKRNDELLFQIKRLQNSHDAVEARARNELGMVKKDETFYQVVK